MYLKKSDSKLARLVEKEAKRQNETLDLIASENITSPAVREALGSELTNKYSEGYPGKRYYAGNAVVDEIETLTQERARAVFGLGQNWHVNVQAYSGSPANLAIYVGLLEVGDKIMGMSLPFGGHLTHGWKVSASGRFFSAVQYGVGRDGLIDYAEVRALAKKEKPKLIICGATAYPRVIDFKKFASIARAAGAYLVADVSHIAGLVAAGAHPSPFEHADVVMTTTHKSLRGPRGALIFANKKSRIARRKKVDIAAAIDKGVFPGLQGGPHNNQTAAIAACLGEASKPAFRAYGAQIVKNARALADELQKQGLRLVSDGTDNHLILIDLSNIHIAGKEAQERLEEVGIITNRNTIPFDTRSPFNPSGLRIGTPSLTTRGMKEKEMRLVAELIVKTLTHPTSQGISKSVRDLCKAFPLR